jgi:hypothetical protein
MKAILVSISALTPVITGAGENQVSTYKNEVLAALDAQRSAGAFVGVSHDQNNWYFCESHADWQSVDHVLLEYQRFEDDTDNLAALEMQIGKLLAADSSTLIVADHALFKKLFTRPLWQLWCCQFDTAEQVLNAKKLVFGEAATLDLALPVADLKAQVRSEIKALLSV